MEPENSLIEQIKTYIDQLDLLGMQESIDEERINNVIIKVKELASKYVELLDSKVEVQIQEAERVYALTLEQELDKRKSILTAVTGKLELITELFGDVKGIEVAAPLQEYVDVIVAQAKSQVADYESDVTLVETQFEEIKKAEAKEAMLSEEKTKAHVKMTNLRNSQISFTDLSEEVVAICSNILNANHADEIDFPNLKAKEEALTKRQNRLLENLELARQAKDAEGYVVAYEGYVKANKLELDKIAEKKTLHLLRKIVREAPVDSYETLESRTKTIQALINSRIREVEALYQSGVVAKEEYETFASKIDFSKIYEQLSNVTEIGKCEKLISEKEEELQHTRDHIKGKEELEAIFVERAKGRGREAVVPEKPEILFEDEVEPKKKRRRVISIEPAKSHLMEKINQAKQFLVSGLTSIRNNYRNIIGQVKEGLKAPEKYKPTIGDKIKLGENAAIFTNPMDVVEMKDGKDAKSIGLTELELYVTRGAILDYTGTPIYITAEYGIDLEMTAKNMNLEAGTYNIALGCSIGDPDGKYIAVTDAQLNPAIEKGWINAADTNLLVITKLNKELEKGGMSK